MSGVLTSLQAKYIFIWDIETVVKYLRTQHINKDLSDKILTLKLTMLLALTAVSAVRSVRN